MTGPVGSAALRRPGLGAADRAGLLPAAARAGAQVRAVQAVAAELPVVDRPRSMVVVGADVDADTRFLTALVGRSASAPIVATTAVPPWVGPLDLVVVSATSPDDEVAAQAAAIAARRGATLVVRGPATGPVADAAGAGLHAPSVAVPESLAAPGRWALLTVMASRAGLAPAPDLTRTADLLDAIAMACHPDAENFVNPGVNLAEYLAAGTPLLLGCDLIADALAGHGAQVLADLGGVAAGVLTAAQCGASPALLRRVAVPADVFADPFEGEDDAPQVVKPLLVSTTPAATADARSVSAAADRRLLGAMVRSFPGAMHLDGSPDALPTVSGPAQWSAAEDVAFRDEPAPSVGRPADGFDAAMAACLRLDFAAVYVGIVTGQLVPLDFPDGLGRTGGSLWAVRPAATGAAWNERV